MMEYDLVIVGAGPAGSTLARVAAKHGVKTLLIEKRDEIGVPKRCGEGLSLNALKSVGLEPSKEWVRQKIRGVFVYSPSGKRVEAKYKKEVGFVIERKVFDKWLAFLAAENGAKVLAGTRAISLFKEGAKISGIYAKNFDGTFKVKSNVVVAADGVESKVARWAGINSALKLVDVCSSVQFEMSNINLENPKTLEIYLGDKIAPSGYVWVFPKGKDRANVGIGIRANQERKALDYLNSFIEKHPNLKEGSIVEVNGGGVPVGNPLKELVKDNFMIIGDAAHQVNAIHGGGIGEAMKAATLAAETVIKAVDQNEYSEDILKEYEKKWFETEGKRLKKLVKLREIIENLSDSELDLLADELSGEDIISLTKGRGYSLLTKIFAKNPRMIRFMPKVLTLK